MDAIAAAAPVIAGHNIPARQRIAVPRRAFRTDHLNLKTPGFQPFGQKLTDFQVIIAWRI